MLIGRDSFGFNRGPAKGTCMHHILIASRSIEEEYMNFGSLQVESSFLQTLQVLNRRIDDGDKATRIA